MSHLGNPIEGEFDDATSLKPIAEQLSKLLGRPVRLEKHWLDNISITGSCYFCVSLFWASQPKQAAKT